MDSNLNRKNTLPPDSVRSVVMNTAPVRVPAALRPQILMKEIQPGFFGTDEASTDEELGFVNPITFFMAGPDGVYRIGFRREGGNFIEFVLQQRIRNRSLSIRLPLCNALRDDVGDVECINQFLENIADFVVKADERGIDVEVSENLGVGQYRLYDSNGEGIVFEESLLHKGDVTKRLNQMLAALALEKAEGFPSKGAE